MARSSVVRVSVLADVQDLVKGFDTAESRSEKLSRKLSDLGAGLTMGVTLPLLALGGVSVKAASDVEEMESKFGIVFGELADEAAAWAASHAESVNRSKYDLMGFMSTLQDTFVPFGMARDEAAELAKSVTTLGVDLASFNNMAEPQVVENLTSALVGNHEAVRKFGVVITQATLDQELFRMGVKGGAKEATEQQKVMARYNLIMAGTSDAQGDAARTSGSFANQMKGMKAQIQEASVSIGQQLLPYATKLLETITPWIRRFTELDEGTKKLIVTIGMVAAAIGPLLLIFAKLITAFNTIKTAMIGLKAVMAANPYILIIAATVALVMLIIANWDKIVEFLTKVWEWIKTTAGQVWETIKRVFKAALDAVYQMFLNWTLPGLLIKHWDTIRDGVRAVVDWFKTMWDGLVTWFTNIPSRLAAGFTGMWDGIKDAFRSALNWIIDKWNNFRLEVRIPTNTLTNLLGIAGQGFSIDTPNIPRFHSGGVFRAPSPGGEGLALLKDGERVTPRGAREQSTTHIELNIHAGMGSDPQAIGRAVIEALQTWSRANGALPLEVRG